MSDRRNTHGVTAGVEPDTDVHVVVSKQFPESPCYERIQIGDLVLWPGYDSHEDADVVAACDHLIEALQEVRAHSLQRLAKAAS